jgi:hypothetical protein
MTKQKGAYSGTFAVTGDSGTTGRVTVSAVKKGNSFSSTSVSVSLPGTKTPHSISLTRPEKSTEAEDK